MRLDKEKFARACRSLGGEIRGNECIVEGKAIHLMPSGYEHDEASVRIDNRETPPEIDFDIANTKLRLNKNTVKFVKEAVITANLGGSVEFEKPVKFRIDREFGIEVV